MVKELEPVQPWKYLDLHKQNLYDEEIVIYNLQLER